MIQMFKNMGKKIKTIAKVICYIGIVICALSAVGVLIAGIIFTFTTGFPIILLVSIVGAVLTCIIGAIGCWLSTFMLYSYGELVDAAKANRLLYEHFTGNNLDDEDD